MNFFKNFFWSISFFLGYPATVLAASEPAGFKDRLKSAAEQGAGFKEGTTPQTLSAGVGAIISLLLSFVGVIFLILIIYAGILWMTAAGNEERAGNAKKIMFNAAIGLAVTLAAYVITMAVVAILA